MTPRRPFTGFRIDPDLRDGLERAAAEEDRSVSYLIRRAIREWLKRRERQKSERNRVVSRKRS